MYFVNLLMTLLPNSRFGNFKARLFRWAGVKVGHNVEIFQGVQVQGIGELEFGDGCNIGHEALFMLNVGGRIIIEPEAVVSSRCIVMTGFHPLDPDGPRIVSRQGTSSTVRIGRGSGVAVGCIVLPGVTIGEMALVASGATVAKDVEPYTLVGGCPAKFIRNLRSQDKEAKQSSSELTN